MLDLHVIIWINLKLRFKKKKSAGFYLAEDTTLL